MICYLVHFKVCFYASSAGMTNLFATVGHFVSYCWVSGPHNFLVILWNLLKTKQIVHVSPVKKLSMFRMLCGPHVRHLCSSETSKYVLLILSKCACLRSSTKCAKMSSTPVEEIVFEQHHTCRLVLLNNKELIARKCHCCPPNSTHCFVMIIFKVQTFTFSWFIWCRSTQNSWISKTQSSRKASCS